MPPLRERREDVPLLVDHFVKKFSAEHAQPITGVDARRHGGDDRAQLPCNVRELETWSSAAVTLAATAHQRDALARPVARPARGRRRTQLPATGFDLERELETFERGLPAQGARAHRRQSTLAARVLASVPSLRYRANSSRLARSRRRPARRIVTTNATTSATTNATTKRESPA